jgi:hypothetical protein
LLSSSTYGGTSGDAFSKFPAWATLEPTLAEFPSGRGNGDKSGDKGGDKGGDKNNEKDSNLKDNSKDGNVELKLDVQSIEVIF